MAETDVKLTEDYNYYIEYSEKFANRINETDKNLCNVNSMLIVKENYYFSLICRLG